MLTDLMIALAGASLISVIGLLLLARNAPEAYEDESGFHLGQDPKDQNVWKGLPDE